MGTHKEMLLNVFFVFFFVVAHFRLTCLFIGTTKVDSEDDNRMQIHALSVYEASGVVSL